MSNRTTNIDQDLIEQFDALIGQVGGDPASFDGKLAREIMHTATKLLRDGADTGEMKLVSRSLKELRYALRVFRGHREVRKVTIFGSARTPDSHADYRLASAFSQSMAAAGWMVITGAGGGIMAAGHHGAGRERSFGVAIRLPFETTANEFIEGDHKLIVFRYFFTRKLIFASQAHAVVLFPGGFGTLDEAYEVLTLVQTGKAQMMPIVLMDPPGATYWSHWRRFVEDELLARGLIDRDDLNLFHHTHDVADAAAHIERFYGNYHSQRFVRDVLVLRLRRALTAEQVEELNRDFAVLVKDGGIEPCEALAEEEDHLELPRLRFVSAKAKYGRLRAMIDRINEMGAGV